MSFAFKSILSILILVETPISALLSDVKNAPELESINGTNYFRVYSKISDDKPWFDGRSDVRHIHCVRPATCEKLTLDDCLGSKIPYTHTSLNLTHRITQNEIKNDLIRFEALKYVPRCWAVVQPFICAVYVPKCEKIKNKDMVYLPSLEMCKITLEPCRLLYNESFFPDFLRCNETQFPPKCNNDVREMKFNGTGECIRPLVSAESSSSYYPGIEGCGVQCEDPLYTDDEHRQIHKLIAWGASLCLASNLFVVATFFIDWENANKYPAVIVFYLNFCFLISCLGWIAQFTPGSREDIVCRKDGTLRHSEPSAGENLSCIVVFVLVYYFLIAAMVWFVFLTYAWNLQAYGKDRVYKKGSYFHLVAWSLPLVLTIATMALSEVDGNSIVGVCFVGYTNHAVRTILLLGPLCSVMLISGCFIILGTVKLFGRKIYLTNIKSTSASNKIHLIIVRMGLCAVLTFVFIFVSITCHLNEFRNSAEWAESLKKYIICKIKRDELCKIENRPSIAMLQLHLLCLFGSGVVMSSWCWTPASIETWKRYIKKKFGREIVEEIKMQKHKVIAQTWAKRKEFDDRGRLSITIHNSYTDPVGLNFDINDLNSSATNEISSTWANYLPQFVKRRFALTGAVTNSSSQGPRKSSLDSEFSFSVRHVSVESRRNSVDSQVSVKIAEMKTKVASRTRSNRHHGKHSRVRNRRRDLFTPGRKSSNRRESSTSVESQVIALKKTSFPGNKHKLGIFTHTKSATKNLKRRSANAGLEPEDITDFISKNGKILFPFLQNQGLTTTSDEEGSRTSFKIHDSRLDVVLRQHEDTDNQNSNPKLGECSDDESLRKQCKLDDILKHIQTSSSFDNFLNHDSKVNHDSVGSRNSKSSLKSRVSRKSVRHSIRRINRRNAPNKRQKKNTSANIPDINDSFTSYSSEFDDALGVQSSYSAMSVGKTQSRNSKTSCDVGIQANAYEIATQTMSLYRCDTIGDGNNIGNIKLVNSSIYKDEEKSYGLKNINNDSQEESQTERHQLLPLKSKANIINAGESEKLKLQMLLLPSK
ncbi:unnamed protein product [Hermetia illucens]|uniref:Protein smoothened n=1 Tax=Hermetia illucens TaxID=343691 RepID=A0A7R8YNP9_HERIL|nr:protein smoothened isoform X2 [Hermetia illucens]XP_037912305.1 protein smoothened isoform X2 [Hermetia illucens]XP_037912315.1 protein smoothened isoform X2 [Hermetia illucens]CAD7078690.1 unnamed protein product [Hermetia illucens]